MNPRAQSLDGPSFASLLDWKEAFTWLLAFGAVAIVMSGLVYADAGFYHKRFLEPLSIDAPLSP